MPHFRTEALRAVGGWDAWNVTEDADLGLRFARFGLRVETLPSSTYEEAPAALAAWLAQRQRWMKGWLQTLATHSREPARFIREVGFGRALAAFLAVASGVIGPLLGPLFGLLLINDAMMGDLLNPSTPLTLIESTLWCFVFVIGALCALWPSVLGMRARGLERFAWTLALLPFYYVLLSLASWRALFELQIRPYYWAKTEHGLARRSRRPPIRSASLLAAPRRPLE